MITKEQIRSPGLELQEEIHSLGDSLPAEGGNEGLKGIAWGKKKKKSRVAFKVCQSRLEKH